MKPIPEDLREAITRVATERQRIAQKNKTRSRKADPKRSDLEIHLEGAIGEAAVSLWANCYDRWLAKAVAPKPLSQMADVGPFHVRTARPGRGLIIKRHDNTDGAYILAWATADWLAQPMGWRFGWECKRDAFWREDVARACWVVPAAEVYCLDSAHAWAMDHKRELAEARDDPSKPAA